MKHKLWVFVGSTTISLYIKTKTKPTKLKYIKGNNERQAAERNTYMLINRFLWSEISR